MLNYNYPLYRPPAEADNIILQATYGCSHNRCSFCSMYKSKRYEIRAIEDLFAEIDILSAHYPRAHKIFLADGDALSLPSDYLLELLDYLQRSFVRLKRVSLYATAQNLLEKSDVQLRLLSDKGLNLIYFGVETGDDTLLKKIHKGVDRSQMIQALHKASRAGIKVSATVILGLGGKAYSREHIQETAKLINATTVSYLSTLHLGLDEDVKERFFKTFNQEFILLDDTQLLEEQKSFLELLDPTNKIIFRSNHASNALHLAGTLPKDRERLLAELTYALGVGKRAFVPQQFRGF